MQWHEPSERIALKAAVEERLRGVRLSAWHLRRVDRRLETYCKEVIGHPERHNVWELLGVERFLGMCRRYGICADAVQRFFRFYEALTFPGATGPARYRLTPVQCFQFASIFGFWEGERRVVREAVLFVPRKFSKTTSSAAVAVWDLLFGDANAESYTGANSNDQAKKCFDVIRHAVRALDPSERRFIVNEQVIKCVIEGRSARAQCLTANARTKDGLNASTVIMDEYSQARDAELLNVLTTSMGVRLNPLTLIITTASTLFDAPFYGKLQGCKDILAGEAEDDGIFAHIFEPDAGDDEADPATWRKVHPHMGVTVSERFYADEYAKAQREGGAALLAFRTKLLNIYASNSLRSWISREDALEGSRPFDLDSVTGTTVAFVGVDFSRVDDLTACAVGYYDRATARFHFVVDYFFPRDALPGHTDEELFRKWAAEGRLHLTDGAVIDYRAVVDHIDNVSRRVPILGVAYDAYGATDFANYLGTMGMQKILFPIPQSYGYFSDPVFSFEKHFKEGVAFIDDNPVTLWCFENCFLDENSSGVKPYKRTASGKIDGVIAILMAERQFLRWRRS